MLAIGYADGYDRRFGNGIGEVFIAGHRARIIGNVCMDMCMVDVTGRSCSPGQEVVLFGEEQPLQDYARDLGTIPYEALTSISSRVRRMYIQG